MHVLQPYWRERGQCFVGCPESLSRANAQGDVATADISTMKAEMPIERNTGLFLNPCFRCNRRADCLGRADNPGRVQDREICLLPIGRFLGPCIGTKCTTRAAMQVEYRDGSARNRLTVAHLPHWNGLDEGRFAAVLGFNDLLELAVPGFLHPRSTLNGCSWHAPKMSARARHSKSHTGRRESFADTWLGLYR